FFFLLGTRMQGALLAPRNLSILLFVGLVAFLQGFTGGREYSIFMFIFLLLGASFGTLPRRDLWTLGAALAALAVVFAVVIGQARGNVRFARGSVADRIYSIDQAAHE